MSNNKIVKKVGAAAAAAAKPKQSKKLYKVSGNSFLDIATGAKKASDYNVKKPVAKKEVAVAPPKSALTVSELWKQKTGTSWSEAKKQGLTDGSLNANLALMKKLKSGEVSKSSLSKPKAETASVTPTSTPTPKPTPSSGSGIGAMERSDMKFAEQGYKRGGSVKRGIKKRRK